MDYKELKNKSLKELNELLSEKQEELRELQFKVRENQLKDVRAIRKAKKSIAQISTAISKKNVVEPVESKEGSNDKTKDN